MGRRKQLAPQCQHRRLACMLPMVNTAAAASGEDVDDVSQSCAMESQQQPDAYDAASREDNNSDDVDDESAEEDADEAEDDENEDFIGGTNLRLRCSVCRKLFKHKKSLQRHVQLHSGVRKHKCGLCSAAFVRSDHLRSHVRTHLAKQSRREQTTDQGDKSINSTGEAGELEDETASITAATAAATTLAVDYEKDSTSSTNQQQNGFHLSTTPSASSVAAAASKGVVYHQPDDRSNDDNQISNNILGSVDSMTAASHLSLPLDAFLANFRFQQAYQPSSLYPTSFAPSICGFCGGLATKQSEAIYHLIVHCARQQSQVSCGVCGFQCRDCDQLRSHASQLHTAQVYRCSAIGCGVLSETSDAAEAHFLRVHAQERRSFTCALCPGEAFERHAELYEHLVGAHFTAAPPPPPSLPPPPPPPAPLQQQQQQSPRQRQMQKTAQQPPTQPPPPLILSRVAHELARLCSYCGRQFADERAVLEHQVREHQLGGGSDSDLFAATSATQSAETIQGSINSAKQPKQQQQQQQILCSQCGYPAKNGAELDRHLKSAHRVSNGRLNNSERQQNWCNICDEKFANQKLLEQHKLTRHNRHHHAHHRSNKVRVSDSEENGLQNTTAGASANIKHCTSCGRPIISNALSLKTSNSIIKSEDASSLLCDACDVTRATLCPFCVQTFDSPTQLRSHLAEQHAVSAPPPTLVVNESRAPSDQSMMSADSLAVAYARLNSLAFEATKSALASSGCTSAVPTTAALAAAKTPAPLPSQLLSAVTSSSSTPGVSSSSRDLAGFYFSKVNGKFTCQVCDKGFTKEDDLTSHRLVHLTTLVSRSEALMTSPAQSVASSSQAMHAMPTDTDTLKHSPMTSSLLRKPHKLNRIISKHRNVKELPVTRRCTYCPKKFSSWKSRLLHHRRRHWRRQQQRSTNILLLCKTKCKASK